MVLHVIDFSKASKNALNPLNAAVRDYIWQELEQAKTNPQITSLILTGGSQNFSAGADISEFDNAGGGSKNNNSSSSNNLTLIDIVDAIENFPKPIIAAIAGTALGGGLELALCCHYRVCDSTSRLGLPEVTVGVVPGAGGTQRLPRLLGLQKALEMIVTAKPIKGSQAHKLGLVDAVVQDSKEELMEAARKLAALAESKPLEDRRVSRRSVPDAEYAPKIAQEARKMIPSPDQGGFVQHCAITAVLSSATMPFEQGKQVELQQFMTAKDSLQGKARRHAFFAVRKAQKPVAAPTDRNSIQNHPLLQQSNTQHSVKVAVVGAGTMGAMISLVLLQAGFAVTLVDISKPALDKGMKQIHGVIQSYVAKQKWSSNKAEQLKAQLSSTQRLEDLTNVQLVVEAVVERMKIKQSIFKTLDQVTPSNCILLSNTSTLDIDQMASVLSPQRQQSFAGWHFFSPAHIMKLVEIVRGAKTSVPTIVLLQALTKRIQKLGVVVGNCYGFCGNRLLRPYGREAAMVLTEGGATTPQQVDKALTKFGMAMGVFTMGDLAGNDIEYNIRHELGWVRDPKTNEVGPNRPNRYTELPDDLVTKLGRIGQKVGKGWYDYDYKVGKGRKPIPSEEVKQFIQKYAPSSAVQLSESEIVQRVMYPLVNEGFKCLEEGIAQRPSDIDIIYLNGYGWPVWRGGPMFWADNEVGLPKLLSSLQQFTRQFPDTEHYKPSKLLEVCVQLGVTVEEYYAKELSFRSTSRL